MVVNENASNISAVTEEWCNVKECSTGVTDVAENISSLVHGLSDVGEQVVVNVKNADALREIVNKFE